MRRARSPARDAGRLDHLTPRFSRASGHAATGVAFGVVAIAVVSGLIAVLEPWTPPAEVTALYFLAIVPAAIGWGFRAAAIVAVASLLTFEFFFAAPVDSLAVASRQPPRALVASLVIALITAYVVSRLARTGHARAREAARAHEEARRLADEQAGLRRVATLVAEGVQPEEIFTAVSEEVGRLFGSELAAVGRFDRDGPAHVVVGLSTRFESLAVGLRLELSDAMTVSRAYRTGRPARADGVDWAAVGGSLGALGRRLGIVSAVSSPVVVEGRLWGAVTVAAKAPLPCDSEARLEQFTALVGTAIANAESREELRQLAAEQAALGRVATLIAQGVSAAAVFEAVVAETETLLGADRVTISRYEPGDEFTVMAHRGCSAERVPPGTRLEHDRGSVTAMVRRMERPVRLDHPAGSDGGFAGMGRTTRIRGCVGTPIVVEGRLWGMLGVAWNGPEPPPANTERRIAEFAQLLGTAIANAHTRAQLNASRARLLAEGDEARRRVVRDLHDGAQQWFAQTIMTLRLAQQALHDGDDDAEALVVKALEQAEQGNAQLRELAHGILPPVLTRGGLVAAVGSVVRRLDLPVAVDVPPGRLPPDVEASAYFIVAEALTNVVKHAHAAHAAVTAEVEDGTLHLEVRDDGIGGADADGHGLVGLGDRATAHGGSLRIDSPAGGGTVVTAELPLAPVRQAPASPLPS